VPDQADQDRLATGASPLTDRDWLRGWAAVLAVVAAMVGGLLWLLNLVMCGCTTRPPA
jgi:hypothetical protein